MQRSTKTQGNTEYEMSSIDSKNYFKGSGMAMQSSGKGSSEKSDAEKGAFREAEVDHEGGVQDVIANEERNLPNGKKKSEPASVQEAVYDSVATITQAMHQQMALFRRMMYLMSVLLLIGFLTAAASVVLAALTSGKIFSWNQPTSSPGTVSFALKRVGNLMRDGLQGRLYNPYL